MRNHDIVATETPDALEEQAWSWLRLFASGDVRESDLQRFRRWARSSPAHQTAYASARHKWDQMEPLAAAALRRHPELVARQARTQRGRCVGRRVFLGATVSAAAAAAAAIVYPPFDLWPMPSEWRADVRTAAGEQKTLALADRVDVMFNTRTSARRDMAGGETVGLHLIHGEAAVDLKGAGRAFAVAAGAGVSTAETGKFEVRHLDDKVCVTCIAGAVQVRHAAGTRRLQARQQVIYSAAGLSDIADIDPADVSAWRSGLLVFRQARMSHVIDEINRYRPGRVILMKDAVRNKAVSGNFAIASLDLALWQLQQAFGLHAESLVGGLVILT